MARNNRIFNQKVRNFGWWILLAWCIVGCFILGALAFIIASPFIVLLLLFRKIGEKIDGMTWEESEAIIKEKHRLSKKGPQLVIDYPLIPVTSLPKDQSNDHGSIGTPPATGDSQANS